MTRTFITLMFFVVIISSCGVTEKSIVGIYKLRRFPKTTLQINPDSTFEFSQIMPNPYLHPFDHPNEYYAYTKGRWRLEGKRSVFLTSQSDTLIYPLTSLRIDTPKEKSSSNFRFYDSYGDEVKILYVQYSDNSIIAAFHSAMKDFDEDLTKRDTLEFHFYGYRPYTFISGKKINNDYSITLKPSFQPGYFVDRKFKVKRKRLILSKGKAKFEKEG